MSCPAILHVCNCTMREWNGIPITNTLKLIINQDSRCSMVFLWKLWQCTLKRPLTQVLDPVCDKLLFLTSCKLNWFVLFIPFLIDDWLSIFGNPTKFGLGIFTIMFDILFICQHYVIYPEHKRKKSDYKKIDSTDDEDTPLLKDEISKINATVQVKPNDTNGCKKNLNCFVWIYTNLLDSPCKYCMNCLCEREWIMVTGFITICCGMILMLVQ